MKKLIIAALLMLSAVSMSARVYVSTDKSCYVAGDVIWCSVFSSDAEAVAYLELRSQDGLVQTAKVLLDGGRGAGSMIIPLTAPTGNYALVSYTAAAKADPAHDYYRDAALVSVFNTLSGDRVKDGVEIVDEAAYAAAFRQPSETFAGVDVQLGDSLVVRNISGTPVSLSVSVFRADRLIQPRRSYIPSLPKDTSAETVEFDGEILKARLKGPDAEKISANPFVTAFVSVPGDKTATYTSTVAPDGTVSFRTDCTYGDRDIVCELEGIEGDFDCHFEMEDQFTAPAAPTLPKLLLTRSLEQDLVMRTASMQQTRALSDTLRESLPVRRGHILLDRECKTYILDDYVRFSTMKELFVEIIKEMRVRKKKGVSRISVLLEDDRYRSDPVWGNSLMLIDGVPFFNHMKFLDYDPALVKMVEIYPYTYSLGDRAFGGVANFVTFRGNMPSTTFDDNVRIYDFKGFSYPESHRGGDTACWEPIVNIEEGGSVVLDPGALKAGATYHVVVEGLSSSGRAVYAVRSVTR